jgi:signal transduction histidine kinase
MNQHPRQILVVEDNPDDLLLVRRALEAKNACVVHHADSLQAAIDHCARSMPDAVLLDLHLPDSVGLETFTRLHSLHVGLPIVVLTGLDDALLGESAIAAGAQDWFRKDDLHPRLLQRVVAHACQRQSLLRALQISESRALANESLARSNELLAKANEAKARLERAAMERMLAIVSHDLRAPVHGIRACIQSLIDHNEVAASGLPLCKAISTETGNLIELATNLIDIDRIANGNMPWHWDGADPGQVVHDVATTLHPLAATVGTRLSVGKVAATPIHGDNLACHRLLTNLVVNAIRHSGAANIELSCCGDGSGAKFLVADDGRGIDPAARARLGKPFATSDESGARGGVGLGLAISLGIADAHGGYLSIISRKGKGTCIKAVLRGDLTIPHQPQGFAMFKELDLA